MFKQRRTNWLSEYPFLRLFLQTRHLIAFGFSAALILFGLLLTFGLQTINNAHTHVQSIVEEHNVKTKLIGRMIWAARERSLDLYTMVSLEDPFERDEVFLKFNSHAATFAQSRIDLTQMHLTEKEKALLSEQGRITRRAVPIQNQVVELVQHEKIPQAYQLLIQEAVPAQNRVLDNLTRLMDLQEQAATSIAEKSDLTTKKAGSLILILGTIALGMTIGIAFIVTRRTQLTEKTLQIEKDLAEVTLHSIGDAVITTDARDNIKDMNPIAEKLTGWQKSQAVNMNLGDILKIHNDQTNGLLENPVASAIRTNSVVVSDQDAKLTRHDDKEFAIEYTAAPITDRDKKIHGGIIIFRDVTPMRTMAYQLSYQASHDALTGLLNRREFEVRLEQAIGNARSEHQTHALCYLDMDQFKIINDTCGHIAGDELLKQIAMRLKSKLRESDLIARLGGDEFGVLLEGCSIEKASEIADELREAIKEVRFVWGDKSFDTGVSIGVVPINNASGNVSDVLSAADTACYEAKDQGRNRIHIYHVDDDNLSKRRGEMQWVHRITDSLDNDKFVLYCQEIMPLDEVISAKDRFFELLVRIKNDDGSLVMPMAFIPAAERYNLMSIIDKTVIEKALQEINKLQSGEKKTHFAINISGQSLCERHFMKFVIEKFHEENVNPELVIFEITETAAIANFTQAIRFINTLKGIGCQFALDDFGSGLSSFAYLKNIPVDYLKIDGYFVRDIVDDPTDSAFVESIHQIGHVMGIKTIAEYVENEYILEKLRTIGVNFGQGYHFGKPQSLNRLIAQTRKKENSSAA